jgi:L-cysteine desulfidase
MALTKEKIKLFLRILSEELEVSLGCTEPIAIAYAAAVARKALGQKPSHYVAWCSGNIIKNAKSVTVPNTGGMKGIEAAVLAGDIGGDPNRELEVLSSVSAGQIEEIQRDFAAGLVKICLLKSAHALHIQIECSHGDQSAMAEIVDSHTNITRVVKNGQPIKVSADKAESLNVHAERSLLNVKDILVFADLVDLEEIRPILEKEIAFNTAISDAGLSGEWGAQIGRTLIQDADQDDVRTRAVARAAAGSDARMSGCSLPVVINSGSGNQGICASLPVIEYARHMKIPEEKLLRALVVSNLVAIHQKTGIGRLSAYCGAVSASGGSGAAIAYLNGAGYEVIAKTIINTIANVGGMICDGAKPSCAAKVASAVNAAIMGYLLAARGLGFENGEGLVKGDVEETITCVGSMINCGMRETDIEILKLMTGK